MLEARKREQAEKLRTIVLRNMIHGPCGAEKPNAPCMYNNQGEITSVCHKSFPKQYNKETIWDDQKSYAVYKRRNLEDGGLEVEKNNRTIDNSWVVP